MKHFLITTFNRPLNLDMFKRRRTITANKYNWQSINLDHLQTSSGNVLSRFGCALDDGILGFLARPGRLVKIQLQSQIAENRQSRFQRKTKSHYNVIRSSENKGVVFVNLVNISNHFLIGYPMITK